MSNKESESQQIPDGIKVGNPATLESLAPKERSTAPPARFTEPQLVAKLEELGIGRPSTYASIVTVNQTRDYVRKSGKALYPTWVGFRVAQFLEAEAMNSVDYAFTAAMEEQLDNIEQGTTTKDAFLRSEWDRITREIIPLSKSIATVDSEVIDLNNGYQVRVIRNNAMLQVAGAPGGTPEAPAEGAWLRDNEDLSMDLSASKCEQLLAEASSRMDSRDFGALEVGPYAGWTVQGKSGKFGQYLSASPPEEGPKTKRPKPVNNQLPEGKDLSTITVAEVREIYSQTKLPRTLTEKLFVGIGKRGPWIGIKETPRGRAKFISMPEGLDPRTVSAEEIEAAVETWKQEQAKKPPRKPAPRKASAKRVSPRAKTKTTTKKETK